MLSVIIPSRNEQGYLEKTIDSVLAAADGEIEIIVVLDGWLPEKPIEVPVTDKQQVHWIHNPESIGQRQAINQAARQAKGKYIMKLDAHCAMDKGFDTILARDCEYDMTMIPTMYNLDVVTWQPKLHKKTNYMYIGLVDGNLRAQYYEGTDEAGNKIRQPVNKKMIDDTMCCMGPCFYMWKDRFWELEGCDENHGGWGQQGVEVALKAMSSGGRLVVNKNTWFAHWFRGGGVPEGHKKGFPYRMTNHAVNIARAYSNDLWMNNKWGGQKIPFRQVLERFWPVPCWSAEKLLELQRREFESDRSGVYIIRSLSSDRVYIGSTINFRHRGNEHKKRLRNGHHSNSFLQNHFNNYGEGDLIFEILEFCNKEVLLEREQYYIDDYSSKLGWDKLFNAVKIAGSSLGHICSEETKRKISESKKGVTSWCKGLTKETDERVASISNKIKGRRTWEEAGKSHPKGMLGKKHSEETKENIRAYQKKFPRYRDLQGKIMRTEDFLKFAAVPSANYEECEKYLTDVLPNRAFYNHMFSGGKMPTWMGYTVIKYPTDLILYQQKLFEKKPDVLVEIGTHKGGSALFFAHMMDLIGHGEVISIDRSHDKYPLPEHNRITYLSGRSTAVETLESVRAMTAGKTVMVVLDGDHRRNQVKRELVKYSEIVTPGQYLVAEDGIMAQVGMGDNPAEAIEWFLKKTKTVVQEFPERQFMLSCNPGGWLRRV